MWQEEKGQGIEFTTIQKKKQWNQVFYSIGEILCRKLFIGKYAYILLITKFLVNCHAVLLELYLSHS